MTTGLAAVLFLLLIVVTLFRPHTTAARVAAPALAPAAQAACAVLGFEVQQQFFQLEKCVAVASEAAAATEAGAPEDCPEPSAIQECIAQYKAELLETLRDCALDDGIPGEVCLTNLRQAYGLYLTLGALFVLDPGAVCGGSTIELSV